MTKVNPFLQTATLAPYVLEKRIMEKLTELSNQPTTDATLLGLRSNIQEGYHPRKIIRWIQELADHNFAMTSRIFGHHLLLTIVNHK